MRGPDVGVGRAHSRKLARYQKVGQEGDYPKALERMEESLLKS